MYYEKQADDAKHLWFVRYDGSHSFPYTPLPHFHNSVELYVVARGAYDVNIGGERRRLRAGEIAFVDRFTPHTSGRVEGMEDMEVYVVVASADYFGGVSFLKKQTLPAFTEKREGFARILDFISFAHRAGTPNEDARRGFVTLLLGLLCDYCGTVPRTGEKHNRALMEMVRYVNEHYDEDISLSSLAERYGYEKTYFSRLFNRTMNMNLREYLNRIRIAAVLRMRKECPHLPLCKIYEACGFESENTFYRAYRRYGDPDA